MAEFERLGGKLVVHEATVADLETYAAQYDLVMVAAGKGAIASLFERDAARSPYDRPQRALALTYVHGLAPRPDHSAVCFNLVPGVGEYFVFPALTLSGPCEIMVFEGVPGGPMDCWADVRTPAEHLARSRWVLETFLPWEAERCAEVELTDDLGVLSGPLRPRRAAARGDPALRRAGARRGRRGGAQRPDHRAGRQQRGQVRRLLPRQRAGARRQGPSTRRG
ncbi:styrene monooxygenase/indole monooxygenase family protein [Nonomuraea dietziae]|uniref:styrene monooxygenase/indole monooxygenase family protein n=1 Tax=Nonomuraea dietziae TaxID=65515 RepID=UPI0031D55079